MSFRSTLLLFLFDLRLHVRLLILCSLALLLSSDYFPLMFVLYLLVTHYLFSRLSSPISLVLSLSLSVVFVSSVSFYIVFFLSISVIIISLFLSHFSFRYTSLPFHLSIRYLCIFTCSVLSLKKLKRSLLDHHAVCPHVSPTNNF
jgi:hypothetical protein